MFHQTGCLSESLGCRVGRSGKIADAMILVLAARWQEAAVVPRWRRMCWRTLLCRYSFRLFLAHCCGHFDFPFLPQPLPPSYQHTHDEGSRTTSSAIDRFWLILIFIFVCEQILLRCPLTRFWRRLATAQQREARNDRKTRMRQGPVWLSLLGSNVRQVHSWAAEI